MTNEFTTRQVYRETNVHFKHVSGACCAERPVIRVIAGFVTVSRDTLTWSFHDAAAIVRNAAPAPKRYMTHAAF